MRDSTQIENLAVSHIVTVFSTSKRICPWLHMGDKEPLWDGVLFLYRTEVHNTSTLCGRVPCQIKGVDLSNEPEKESYYLTKEELANNDEIMAFMAENHRRSSYYFAEERNNWNWMRHQQKLMGKGELKEERIESFERLIELCGEYKHVNQYT